MAAGSSSAPGRSTMRRRGTMARPNAMPPTAAKHPVKIHPSYIRELRARVEAVGVVAVARAAKVDRRTVWRHLSGGEGRRPSASAIESIRLAVAGLQPDTAPMPPPIVSVRGLDHFAWIEVADLVSAEDLPRVTAEAIRLVRRRK